MNHQDLKLFLHLAETLHFGKTSAACHMSPSTLSRQIQQLEAEVGQTLFERDNRSVRLTWNGMQFSRYAKETLDRWNEFQQSLNMNPTELNGEISMYCSVTASYSVLPGLLSAFRQKHPRIEIKLRTGDPASSIDKVNQGDVDIVIAARPDRLPQPLGFITVAVSPLVFIAPGDNDELNALLGRDAIPWQRIPMIIPERGLARKRIDQWFKRNGIKPLIYAQVLGNEGIVSMVNLGFGVGVVPDLVLKNSPFADRIDQLDIADPLEPYHVGVCIRLKKLRNPLIRAFWEVAQAHEQVLKDGNLGKIVLRPA